MPHHRIAHLVRGFGLAGSAASIERALPATQGGMARGGGNALAAVFWQPPYEKKPHRRIDAVLAAGYLAAWV